MTNPALMSTSMYSLEMMNGFGEAIQPKYVLLTPLLSR